MLREKFAELVMQEATAGFSRGIELFIESLNSEISRDEAIEEGENNLDNYLDTLFEGVN